MRLHTLVYQMHNDFDFYFRDTQPIVDHFRKVDDDRLMGAMVIEGDERVYFFELERVEEV